MRKDKIVFLIIGAVIISLLFVPWRSISNPLNPAVIKITSAGGQQTAGTLGLTALTYIVYHHDMTSTPL